MAWHMRGRVEIAPTRGSAYHQSTIARKEEVKVAPEAENRIGHPSTAQAQLIISHAHAAMGNDRDGDFAGSCSF